MTAQEICLLQKTALRNNVFLKGALWSLFIPVLFVGRMKLFYENTLGIILFSWWAKFFKKHVWVYWLYIGGVFVYALLLWAKRRKMKKLAVGMEKRKVGDTVIYVTKLPVTPAAIGLLRTKIVMPEIRNFKASVIGWKRLSAISRNPVIRQYRLSCLWWQRYVWWGGILYTQ